MANALATTLTGFPVVPYWRAGGPLVWGLDCMVYYVVLQMLGLHTKKVARDTMSWSTDENGADKELRWWVSEWADQTQLRDSDTRRSHIYPHRHIARRG